MSPAVCRYDNTVAERFFWSLRHELTKFESYENLDKVKISVYKYIEIFYNQDRLNQTLDYRSSIQSEVKAKDTISCVITSRRSPPVLGYRKDPILLSANR